LLALSVAVGLPPSASFAAGEDDGLPAPVDPQAWVDQEDLTWDAFTPVPGQPQSWRDGSERGTQNDYTGAVVLLDFADQPFVITQEPEEHPFGNPQPGWEPIARSEVRAWMEEYLNTPNEYNGGQSITGYWMEDSHGKISVDLTAFGPYELPGKLHEYGLADFAPTAGPGSRCPLGDVCNKSIRNDGLTSWSLAEGPGIDGQFDFIFYVTAGHDESSTWQEFGEMIFQTQDDVPAAFGPPGAGGATPILNNAGEEMPNWSPTRYVPWTSWRAAANHWPNASGGSTTQAESSGQSVYAHEFSHVRGLPDNYNNPFADNIRNYTGYWEMMSRGTFNGPGGTHNRWQIPNVGGSGLGPHHMLHFKQMLGVLDPSDQVTLNRGDLVDEGIAVVTLKARSSVPDGDPVGLQVALGDGGYSGQKCQEESQQPSFWCPPGTNWQNYTLEVVDRVGSDSYAPGHGVLLALSRSSGTPRVWSIDSNPQDINMIDFYRPDGTPVSVVRGDPRQLNDATFHAGTDSAAEYEYEDNGLHFYILDKHRDSEGVLYYTVAVRNLDGSGAFARGVEISQPAVEQLTSTTKSIEASLMNTGDAGAALFDSDVYRISASVEGAGWNVWLPYEVRAARAGETVPVHVYATAEEGAADNALVTITATSEADPSVAQSIVVDLSQGGGGGGGDEAEPTTLTLTAEGKGANRSLVARLAPADDPASGIAGQVIRFFAEDGTALGDELTNDDGVAVLPLPPAYRSPKRSFTATFEGDVSWLPSSASI
jgi:M6 family metalloprotease-like protein